MHVAEIWRYPVKSMGGEQVQRTLLGPLGVEGDRVLCVEGAEGRVITSRSHPRLLGHHASLRGDGVVLIDGRQWDDRAVAAEVADIAGRGGHLVPTEGEGRFDVLPLLIATDGAITAFGHDRRRLRPNIIVGGVDGLAEREWEGGVLRVGQAVIGVDDLRLRCVMTSYDPDTQVQDKDITRGIYRRFGGKLALNCFVIEGGEIEVGNEVRVEGGPRG